MDVIKDELSIAERKVIILCLNGLTNPQIAKELNISASTVATHLMNISTKYQVNNRLKCCLTYLVKIGELNEKWIEDRNEFR